MIMKITINGFPFTFVLSVQVRYFSTDNLPWLGGA